ncbi:DUF4062 domain-containing protein [Paenibacillus lutimineralis]|uniref:DUF4062 domain-containing protein n=1 Tax=Paenibacillus lutimineralis TaxID=2707005 RepID=A0A3Q9ICN4_9BACL|nr:DUF4062 domain-containing protein [Paenibacillus lutimineralis]AZS17882.1 DUF4062 domain-containing protein [Paenibacillus lutimineralis]
MRKKLQVYISSTFPDLIEERHTAVESVLKAGHIPAGIEQFFKLRQLGMMKKWIDESDIFILILGGLYGNMLHDVSKSHVHWEYDYAGEVGKPRFAFVLTDEALREKPYDFVVLEDYPQYLEFKKSVQETVPFYHVEDMRHIQMVLRDQLPEYGKRDDLNGWYSGKDLPDVQKLLEENAKLKVELEEMKRANP